MPDIPAFIGLLRSLLIYYGHPRRHARLKNLYAPFVREGDLVFDIGAHVGNHSRAFRALGARVIAVEPQPLFSAFLARLARRDPQLSVLSTALGPEPGEADLLISARTPTVSTLSAEWHARAAEVASFAGVRWDQSARVQVRTLDELITDHGRPTFIKLDVEGSEADVLEGLSTSVPALSFEVLPSGQGTGVRCLAQLNRLGEYEYNWFHAEAARLWGPWVDAMQVSAAILSMQPDWREMNVFARKIHP